MSSITEIAMYAPCKVKSTRSGKEYSVSKIDYTQNLVSCSNGKTAIWLYPADLEIIDSERKCYPKQDVDMLLTKLKLYRERGEMIWDLINEFTEKHKG